MENKLGMTWHYIYNIFLTIASSIPILYLTLKNIFDYFMYESIWLYLLCGSILCVALTNLIKQSKTTYILTIIFNSILNIAIFFTIGLSISIIIEDLLIKGEFFDGLGIGLGTIFILICIPILIITIVNFIYYKKRKNYFIENK